MSKPYLFEFIHQLFCRHKGEHEFFRNLRHGEEYGWSGNRSLWRCKACHALIAKPEPHETPT